MLESRARVIRAIATAVVVIVTGVTIGLFVMPNDEEGPAAPKAKSFRQKFFEAEAQQSAGAQPPNAEAKRLVDSLYIVLVRKADVLDHIRNDPAISEPTRKEALALAEQFVASENELNNASWYAARKPGCSKATYERTLLLVEEACRLRRTGYYVNTLGVVQYRLGRFKDAIVSLNESYKMNLDDIEARHGSGPHPADLSFLAMAHFRLGEKEKANEWLDELQKTMKSPPWASDSESLAFLKEAETLIGQSSKSEP